MAVKTLTNQLTESSRRNRLTLDQHMEQNGTQSRGSRRQKHCGCLMDRPLRYIEERNLREMLHDMT